MRIDRSELASSNATLSQGYRPDAAITTFEFRADLQGFPTSPKEFPDLDEACAETVLAGARHRELEDHRTRDLRTRRRSRSALLQRRLLRLPGRPIATEAYRVISAAMTEIKVVGLGRLTLSRRERMVLVEPRGAGMTISLMTLRIDCGFYFISG
jgi:DNA end-binding protein Ku